MLRFYGPVAQLGGRGWHNRRVGKPLAMCALALVLVISPAGANPGDDQWKPMIQDGFGDAQTVGVEELEAVGELVFAATRRQAGSGAAGIFATAAVTDVDRRSRCARWRSDTL